MIMIMIITSMATQHASLSPSHVGTGRWPGRRQDQLEGHEPRPAWGVTTTAAHGPSLLGYAAAKYACNMHKHAIGKYVQICTNMQKYARKMQVFYAKPQIGHGSIRVL
jgi:hypothetical protein